MVGVLGQKNCSLKAEDELTQIIGNYKVTSDIEWLNLKAELAKKSAFEDENSNSLDSGRESGIGVEEEESKREFSEKMDSSEVDSLLSEVMTHSSELSEALLTDNITQAVDIRISPTVELISFDEEFSLVADVEVEGEPPNGDFQQPGTLHFEHVSVKDIPTKQTPRKKSDAFSVESKIAQEIKEMKQREEDLRRMREQLAKLGNPPKETPSKPKAAEPKATTNGHQDYNPANVFGGKRKAPPQTRRVQQESPIEREIRMVKEREEELRRDRALRVKMQLEDDDASLCSDSSFLLDSGSVCSLDSKAGSSPSPDFQKKQHGVNMERFIASKGKQVVFKKAADYMVYEIRPPQVKKGHQHRKFVTAATKIQSELQEMKEREEELKKERGGQQLAAADLNDNSTAICSRPDFLENGNTERNDDENDREVRLVNQNRRRSSLIEEWERRIQKMGVQA